MSKAKICSKGHKYTGDKCPHCPGANLRPVHKTRLFGTTIRETGKVFQSIVSSNKSQTVSTKEKNVILIRTIASLTLAVVAIYFFTHEKQDVGFGLGGSILGYWLK
ncbi:MAG: hypothetical protein LBI82_13805 [Dysgonamonadaceae bacterium]|jgi:hypothetical protein|nr:hypothetical protein [Dysgonamonadaceae bacterium]